MPLCSKLTAQQSVGWSLTKSRRNLPVQVPLQGGAHQGDSPWAASDSMMSPLGVVQHAGHQAQGAVALRHDVRLHVAVVVPAGDP